MAVEVANTYRELYINEKAISKGNYQADSISRNQYKIADTAFKDQVDKTTAESERADKAEAKVAPLEAKVAKLEGRTLAGKFLRKARDNVLAPVGLGTIIVFTAKLVF